MAEKNRYLFDIKKIDDLLRARGETRADLARTLGKSYNTIKAMLENSSLTTDTLVEIANYFDLSLLDFIYSTEGGEKKTLTSALIDYLKLQMELATKEKQEIYERVSILAGLDVRTLDELSAQLQQTQKQLMAANQETLRLYRELEQKELDREREIQELKAQLKKADRLIERLDEFYQNANSLTNTTGEKNKAKSKKSSTIRQPDKKQRASE